MSVVKMIKAKLKQRPGVKVAHHGDRLFFIDRETGRIVETFGTREYQRNELRRAGIKIENY